MTVIEVYGKVDSVDVIFTPLSNCPNRWKVAVPFDDDGMYLCEVWAVDDDGNIAYRTAILYITDGEFTSLCFTEGFTMTYTGGNYSLSLTSSTRQKVCT